MPVDFLSALNSNGSGLDIRQLSTDLAAAAFDPRRSVLNDKMDSTELSLSAYDRLKLKIGDIKATLNVAKTLELRTINSSGDAVSVAVSNARALKTGNSEVAVTAIAQSQVLEFSGFSSLDDAVGAGTLTVDFGAWTGTPAVFNADADRAPVPITFTADASVSDVAEALSQVNGITARVIETDEGAYSLGVTAATGLENALRFTVSAGADPGLSVLDFSADVTPVQRRAAADAELVLDGITVIRDTNDIDDLIEGASFSIKSVTAEPITLTSGNDTDTAKIIMESLLEEFNATKSLFRELTTNDIPSEEAGSLSGDATARSLKQDFDRLLSSAFGDGTIYLSDLGVRTERDGTLSLDVTQFERAFAANPDIVETVLRNKASANVSGVTIDSTAGLSGTGGVLQFLRDPLTNEATIGRTSVSGVVQDDGRVSYNLTTGLFAGLTISVEPDVSNAEITIGNALSNKLTEWFDKISGSTGALERSIDRLNESKLEWEASLDDLDARSAKLENRYLVQFTEMERVVSQLNSTGDYLTGLLDAWNNASN